MNTVSDLTATAQAADPACVGCALIGAQPVQSGWVVAERADGLRVRVDGVPTDSPAVAAVLALDLNETAARAREVQRLASAAMTDTLDRGRVDPFAAAMLSLFDIAFTLINDLCERNGDARLQQSDLVPLAVAALVARQGAPPAVPPAPPALP